MVYEQDLARKIAHGLLQINAIKINLQNPVTWASGWQSPIYCDNRISLSNPELRNQIANGFVSAIKRHFPKVNCIAAVATAGIAHGMLVADRLDLPFVYVRSSAKDHGMKNLIEGQLPQNAFVLVIEDLISTGKSSLNAVKALREKKAEIAGLMAIFSYGFELAENAFRQANCKLITLSGYQALLQEAIYIEYIDSSLLPDLNLWRENPAKWKAF